VFLGKIPSFADDRFVNLLLTVIELLFQMCFAKFAFFFKKKSNVELFWNGVDL
jgi:hypothetical protein